MILLGGRRVGFRFIFKVTCSDVGWCSVVPSHLYRGERPWKLLIKEEGQMSLLFLFSDQSGNDAGKGT